MPSALFWIRVFFVLLAIFVSYVTIAPNPDSASGGLAIARWISEHIFRGAIPHDKIAHFMAYASLGAAAYFARLKLANSYVLTVCAVAIYGAMLEGVQALGGVRSPEMADAAANGLGAVSGFAGASIMLAVLKPGLFKSSLMQK